MTKRIASLVICIVISTTMIASAGTIHGVTGLIEIPNADALPPQALDAGLRVVGNHSAMSVTFGLAPRIEVGVNSDLKDNYIGFTIKGVVFPETRENPGMAVGYDTGSLYFVLSKAFNSARGHIGFGDGPYNGVFAGLSIALNPVTVSKPGQIRPTTSLLLEHNGRNLSAGLRFGLTPNLKADIAMLNMEKAMIGLNYSVNM